MSQLIASPSAGSAFAGVTTDNTTVFGDGLNVPLYSVTSPTGKGLKQGGALWSGTGFVFDVSDLYFYIDNTNYVSSATQVTLDPADPSQDRFDIIVVDDSLNVSVVTGTPGTPPAQPELAWNQVGVTIVLVSAGSTTPTINYDLMYNEDTGSPTEWVASTYSLSGAVGTINNASTVNPFNGTKCIKATAVNIRRGSLLTRATDVNIQNFSSIQFAFRLDSAITTAQNFNIRFRNSGGTFIGNTVSVFNWGASRTVIGTNQVVVIPITAFGNITNVRSIVGIMAGGSTIPTYNWAWDFIKLSDSIPFQSNLGPIFLSASNTLYSTGAANGATSALNSQFFGNLSGFGASMANFANFQGYYAGYSAVNAEYSLFIGNKAGFKAANANDANFQGSLAGYGAINANYSQFIGTRAGFGASSAYSSSFLGASAGDGATNAYQSVFIGRESGLNALSSSDSFFLGYQAGSGATNASTAAFLGSQAGKNATNAAGSVFIGYQAGNGATDALNCIFIGSNSGLGDTTTSNATLIGYQGSSGGFIDVIGLGAFATNTANNQMMIGSTTIPINQVVVNGTGGIQVPVGTTGERIATQGMIRYNTTTSKFEGYNGSIWVDLN